MFGGSFAHKLDEVGRFIVPRKFRMSLGEPFVITKGVQCLVVMTADRFNEIHRQAQGLDNPLSIMFNPEARRIYHQLFAEMVEVKVDGQSLKSERVVNLDQMLYPSPYWRNKNIGFY